MVKMFIRLKPRQKVYFRADILPIHRKIILAINVPRSTQNVEVSVFLFSVHEGHAGCPGLLLQHNIG